MGRGVVALRFDPTGRFGFAVNQVENVVAVIDSATGEVAGRVEVVKGPDQVVFTDRYAYVRGTGSEKFSLVELSGIAKGKFAAVDVTAGQKPASALPAEIGVADMIATTPEGNAAMIANTPDGMIYYYVEGMMAPMGTLSNYKRRPHAAMILDRSLAEVAPGVYSVPVRLKARGASTCPCSPASRASRTASSLRSPTRPTPRSRAPASRSPSKRSSTASSTRPASPSRSASSSPTPTTGQPLKGLKDVQVLAFEPPGIWQQRQWATEVGEGEYEVTQTFPRPGLYKVMLRSASRGAAFADLPYTSVPVTSGAETVEKDNGKN